MIQLDAKGLSCPLPVIKTKEIIDKTPPSQIQVIVDNEAACENVTRFLTSHSYAVTTYKEQKSFTITGQKEISNIPATEAPHVPQPAAKKIMVLISSDKIGHGDALLGEKLMESFISTLKEMGDDLWRIVFVNSGVKLTLQDAPVLSLLMELEKKDVMLLVCGTCLTHFNLLDQKAVGQTTNMLDIVTSMQVADQVIPL